MTDIVERLRNVRPSEAKALHIMDLTSEAADEIERLRASAKAWELIAKAPADWKELPERKP
jgi:hypothetical protein